MFASASRALSASTSSRQRGAQSILCLVALACVIGPTAGIGGTGDCVDYATYFRQVGNVFLGWENYTGPAALSGDVAYLISSNIGGGVAGRFDLSDPGHPASQGGYGLEFEGPVSAMGATGDLVVLLGSSLEIVDFTDPLIPLLRGSLDVSGTDLAVSGSLAFVAEESAALSVVDFRDPDAPTLIGALAGVGGRLALIGTTLLSAAPGAGMHVIDVSDPSDPSLVTTVPMATTVHDLAASSSLACAAVSSPAPGAFLVFDLTDPAAPVQTATVPLEGAPVSLAVAGTTLLVGSSGFGVLSFDVSDTSAPRHIGAIPASGGELTIDGTIAVGTALHGLGVLELANPASPPIVGFELVQASGVAVDGALAYTAGFHTDLTVLDLSDPSDPTPIGNLPTAGNGENVVVQDAFAFMAAQSGGLQIIDVSVPDAPALVATVPVATAASDVAVQGSVALVRDTSVRNLVVDVSDPTAPVVESELPPGRFALIGDLALIATGTSGLRMYDLATLSMPVEVGSYGADVSNVVAEGDLAVIAGGSDPPPDFWTRTLDISDPSNPVPLGFLSEDLAFGGVLDAACLYAGGSSGVEIWDLSDPYAPRVIGQSGANTERLAVADELVVTVAGGAGLRVIPAQCKAISGVTPPATSRRPAPFRIAGPNPTARGTGLELVLPISALARVSVYDAAGRLVRTVADQRLSGGEHRWRWDGRDTRGRLLPSGVYFARAAWAGQRATQRIIVVR